jgi:hypothetical protein
VHYSAAWTDSGFLLGCSHERETIAEADSSIPCSGGYVVAVENGAMRSLTEEEESEFQCAHHAPRTDNPVVETTPRTLEAAAVSDPRYAVMVRIRVGDRWIWTTWMCHATYAEATVHARNGNKVVRFRSAEYMALRKQTEAASPLVIRAPRETIPPQGEAETFFEFVNRFLSAYGSDQHGKHISDVKCGLINTEIIHSILSRLSESESGELERIYAENERALMDTLEKRFHELLRVKAGRQ